MPRRVDPHLSEDAYTYLEADGSQSDTPPEWWISRTALLKAAEAIGVAGKPESVQKLEDQIRMVATRYLRWHRRGAGRYGRAEARRALEWLLAQESIDRATVMALNERAQQRLLNMLLTSRPPPLAEHQSVIEALHADAIPDDRLREAARAAVRCLKTARGADREGNVSWVVWQLCETFEQLTGSIVTLSNKKELHAYSSEPRSAAGKFIMACLEVPRRMGVTGSGEPDARFDWGLPSKVSEAMRHYVKARSNSSSADQPPPLACGD